MKTLHLTNAWHPTSGGIATFYRSLLDAAARHRRLIRVIKPAEETRVEEVNSYARIYHLRAPRAPLDRRYRMLLPHQMLLPGSPVWKIVRDEQPDLVEVCDKYTLPYLAAMLRRGWLWGVRARPVVVGLSCERLDDNIRAYVTRARFGRTFARLYMKWLYFPFFDQHITISRYTAAELVQASRGHAVTRCVWIEPMGVDDEMFTPARRSKEARQALLDRCQAPQDAVLVLYAGRLAREKNVSLLVDTMAALHAMGRRQYYLIVAGDGTLREHLAEDCRRLIPGQFSFLGHIRDREQLATLLANVDAFVHTNPHEPFGIAPLEAMASGTPLVAPRTGGVTAYANAQNAWLAEPTVSAFAQALEEMVRHDENRRQKVRWARLTAENFSWRRVTANYFALYDELSLLKQGVVRVPRLQPAFQSTAGNWFGKEI